MPVPKLTSAELNAALVQLKGWELVSEALEKKFHFSSFRAAMDFINRVAVEAEEMNHHPDWSNSYSSVHIRLFTHNIKGLSQLDLELAKRINKLTDHGI
jgi:4a-hydroxytetrahydrobiopterin dehydratase